MNLTAWLAYEAARWTGRVGIDVPPAGQSFVFVCKLVNCFTSTSSYTRALISEYGISLSREVGYNPDRPKVSGRRMVGFAETIHSLRIAVHLKVELFRNAPSLGPLNAIHDIDALSMAVSYCHIVVADREMTNLERPAQERSQASHPQPDD